MKILPFALCKLETLGYKSCACRRLSQDAHRLLLCTHTKHDINKSSVATGKSGPDLSAVFPVLSSLVFPLKREDKADFQQCVSEMLPLRSSGAAGRCLELHNREEVAPF